MGRLFILLCTRVLGSVIWIRTYVFLVGMGPDEGGGDQVQRQPRRWRFVLAQVVYITG